MATTVTTRTSTRISVIPVNPNRIRVQFLGVHVLLVHAMHGVECHLQFFLAQHLLDDLHWDFL